eukprot:TRINITY_DN7805_c0_g1_i5.p1 TRINITY_DN7805_c0_g1~~TRINITY_DN7805_c0_g1_i5.p1  ORF type:complete len:450 (-),score=91.86 TRINITY_DN7805_c0_g1_i5:132-1481(-)
MARALKHAGYRTGMGGKWHLGINSNGMFQDMDYKYTPTAHGYDHYLGAPFTNAPFCEMDENGISQKIKDGPEFCFMMANDTVVQQPLRLENFTETITDHAVRFIATSDPHQPWFFMMSYFHVHTPLFTSKANRGRSKGGKFGDNVEELDDSVGEILAALQARNMSDNTLIFLTSDNGPYSEEGWDKVGRTNLYSPTGELTGRLKGGKGQLYEGGVRMPGTAIWPGVIPAGRESDVMVSSMDMFPTALAAAGVKLPSNYSVDGKDMLPVLKGGNTSQHDVFLHYCGFKITAARVDGTWKVFWNAQKWNTHKTEPEVCTQCCSGVNPWSRLTDVHAAELCGCGDSDYVNYPDSDPLMFNMINDPGELYPVDRNSLPEYDEIVAKANAAKLAMQAKVHPTPDFLGAGTCTAGFPSHSRQPCCPGCLQPTIFHSHCHDKHGNTCTCNTVEQEL